MTINKDMINICYNYSEVENQKETQCVYENIHKLNETNKLWNSSKYILKKSLLFDSFKQFIKDLFTWKAGNFTGRRHSC